MIQSLIWITIMTRATAAIMIMSTALAMVAIMAMAMVKITATATRMEKGTMAATTKCIVTATATASPEPAEQQLALITRRGCGSDLNTTAVQELIAELEGVLVAGR